MTARITSLRPRLLSIGVALALGAAALPALAQSVSQDPPARAGRIAWLAGPVSLSPNGTDTWAQAPLNRPLVAGDRLWTDAGARDEAQFGPVVARMDAGTLLTVLAADEGATQLQVSQGRIDLHVRRIDPNTVVEIDTPNLAFVARAPGDYRIVVSPDGASTDVAVLRGGGDVYGDGNAYSIGPNQGYRFAGQDLQNLGNAPVQPYDDFDRWAFERDARLDRAQSARFVPADVVGYEDLDDNGAWRVVPDYGTVWVPTRVASDWAPYQSGHWAWIDPWGWTWVDDQPWGYAVSHYGRWVNLENRWAWVPAPARERPVFAPALVAFVGAALASGGRGDGPGVGWFPLGPHEPYRPWYHASAPYVTRINVSNTPFGRGGLDGFIDHPDRIRYANRGVPGALMAMPAAQFASAMPARRFGRAFDPRMALSAPLTLGPGARPLPQSRIGTAPARQRPPELAQRRLAVARSLPPGLMRHEGRGFAQGGALGRADFGPGATVPVRMLRPAGGVKPRVPPLHGGAGQPGGGRQFAVQQFGGQQFSGRPGQVQHGLAALPGQGPGGAAPAVARPGQAFAHGLGAAGAPMAGPAPTLRGDGQHAAGQGAMPHGAPERAQSMHLQTPSQVDAVRSLPREAHAAPQAHGAPRAEMHAAQRDMPQPRPEAAPAFQARRDMQQHQGQQQRHDAPPQQRHDAPPPQQRHEAPPQQHHDAPPQQQRHEAPPQQRHDAPPPQRHDAPPPQHHDAPPQQQHHDAPPPQQHHDAPPQHQGGGGGGDGGHGHGREHGH